MDAQRHRAVGWSDWLGDGDEFISVVACCRPVQSRVAFRASSRSQESEMVQPLGHVTRLTTRTSEMDHARRPRQDVWRIKGMWRRPWDWMLWLVAPRHLWWRLLARHQNESRLSTEFGEAEI